MNRKWLLQSLQKGNSLILKRQKLVRLSAILSIYSLNFLNLQPHIMSLQKCILLFKKWRSIGIKYVIYLNDDSSSTFNNCKECKGIVLHDFSNISVINTSTLIFSVPKRKVDKLNNINSKNGYTFKQKPKTTKILFTDASNTAYRGYILERPGKKICFSLRHF